MKRKLLKVFYNLFAGLTLLICGANIAYADAIGPVGVSGGALILILGLICLALAAVAIAIIVGIRKKNAK